MAGQDALQGLALYEALMAIKPAGLAETDWATQAGVNRSFFSNMKGKGTTPRVDTLRKVLNFIGKSEADLSLADSQRPPQPNGKVVRFEGESLERPQENLPVWGSALGVVRMFEGEAIEQTDLNTGSELEYVRRPAILSGKREAYALHVQGSSMHPALPDGEVVVVCRGMPLSRGDNVVVYLRDDQNDDGDRARGVLVKELVRRSGSYVELRQYEPKIDFRVDMKDVLRIDRILTRREMVS